MSRPLETGDRVRLTLGGPVFRVERVTTETVRLTPEVARMLVEHYGLRFSVPMAGLDLSASFVPAEVVERHRTPVIR